MIQTCLLDAIEAESRKQEGMRVAVDHAEKEEPGWAERAYGMLETWLTRFPDGYTFKTEDFRLWSDINGLSKPPSLRAFGAIIVKAAKNGIVTKVGHTTVLNPTAHKCFCSLWRVNK